eukprot:GHVO01063817.1.p1 GENE.GHVO01063817.1~~GHVO01063817.1.p1  ORF type:complete len:136 (+),score=4.72 GHVO01063817.1:1458-1865(+)
MLSNIAAYAISNCQYVLPTLVLLSHFSKLRSICMKDEFVGSHLLLQQQLCAKDCETDELKRSINNLEQYSRRSHVRIHGLDVPKGENCKKVVTQFLSSQLTQRNGATIKVNPTDIDAAHTYVKQKKAVSLCGDDR